MGHLAFALAQSPAVEPIPHDAEIGLSGLGHWAAEIAEIVVASLPFNFHPFFSLFNDLLIIRQMSPARHKSNDG
jgi:hypothetical protein